MGQTNMESFRNYQIPGVGGPSPMIAVFWDDLKHLMVDVYILGMTRLRKNSMLNGLALEPTKIILKTFQAVLYDLVIT